jgi:DNA-binding NtrC family response regulator
LGREGCDVSTLTDLKSALDEIKRPDRPLDIVFIGGDIHGPMLLEAIRAIRERDAKLPIVLITTEENRQSLMSTDDLGKFHILPNPFTYIELRQLVAEI